jgi:hypothetical protein
MRSEIKFILRPTQRSLQPGVAPGHHLSSSTVSSSWRKLIPSLADTGYHAITPDQPPQTRTFQMMISRRILNHRCPCLHPGGSKLFLSVNYQDRENPPRKKFTKTTLHPPSTVFLPFSVHSTPNLPRRHHTLSLPPLFPPSRECFMLHVTLSEAVTPSFTTRPSPSTPGSPIPNAPSTYPPLPTPAFEAA